MLREIAMGMGRLTLRLPDANLHQLRAPPSGLFLMVSCAIHDSNDRLRKIRPQHCQRARKLRCARVEYLVCDCARMQMLARQQCEHGASDAPNVGSLIDLLAAASSLL